jgi:hypothetical protein
VNVLVIPEDFRKDQYVLKPIIRAMMGHILPRGASVEVCLDPLLGGIGEVRKWHRIENIIQRYRYRVDLFMLCVDRDGIAERRAVLDHIEARAAAELTGRKVFVAEHAWQEIEVWALAGLDLPTEWVWKDIRAEPNPKEVYFDRLAAQRGVGDEPGGGRETFGEEAARRYNRIRQLCPEDVAVLEDRIRAWIGAA